MNNLVTVENGIPVTTSQKVAEVFQRSHKSILNSIYNTIKKTQCLEPVSRPHFVPATYIDAQGKQRPYFLMDKKTCDFFVMQLNGKDVLQYQVRFIEAFKAMEKALLKQTQSNVPDIPKTYADALRCAADAVEAKEKEQQLRIEMQQKNEELEERNDVLCFENKCIADELYDIKHYGEDKFIKARKIPFNKDYLVISGERKKPDVFQQIGSALKNLCLQHGLKFHKVHDDVSPSGDCNEYDRAVLPYYKDKLDNDPNFLLPYRRLYKRTHYSISELNEMKKHLIPIRGISWIEEIFKNPNDEFLLSRIADRAVYHSRQRNLPYTEVCRENSECRTGDTLVTKEALNIVYAEFFKNPKLLQSQRKQSNPEE